jgi:enoyl-CoA hydratase
MDDHLQQSMDAGVLTLTLNRPDKLNALTPDIYRRIGDLISTASGNPECRVIVLKGAGRAFSSGFDLKLEVSHRTHADKLNTLQNVANRARWAIWESPKPVVASIHGYCLGGAFELMLPCDFTIATDDCQLGEPEILFGAGPAFMLVPWMVGHKTAKDILLTGRRLSAMEALAAGLITAVVSPDKLQEATDRLVDTLKGIPSTAITLNKRGINRAYETMGMRPHLESWGEAAAYLSFMIDEEGSEFQRILQEKGTTAALRWREERFGGGSRSARGMSE